MCVRTLAVRYRTLPFVPSAINLYFGLGLKDFEQVQRIERCRQQIIGNL